MQAPTRCTTHSRDTLAAWRRTWRPWIATFLILAQPSAALAADPPKPCLYPEAARALEAIETQGFNIAADVARTPVWLDRWHPFKMDSVCVTPQAKRITPTSGGDAHWQLRAYIVPYSTTEAATYTWYDGWYQKNFGEYWRQTTENCDKAAKDHPTKPGCQEMALGNGDTGVVAASSRYYFPGPLFTVVGDANASLQCGSVVVQVTWRHYSSAAERDSQIADLKALNDAERGKAYIQQRDAERVARGMSELRAFMPVVKRALEEKQACGRPGKATASSAPYATEWVWILSVHEARLDKLAADITEKYRAVLGIPSGRVVGVAEWLNESGDIHLVTPGAPSELYEKSGTRAILPHSQVLAAARADFGARRQALDHTLAEAYRRWVETVSKGDASAIVGLWQAADDLRKLRAALYGTGKTPVRAMLVDSAGKIIETGIGQFFKHGPKYTDMVNVQLLLGNGRGAKLIGLADDKAWEKLADKAEDHIKEQITTAFRQVIGAGDHKQLDALADKLVRWADTLLDEIAYPSKSLGGDYRQLGTNRFFNIDFSLNFLPEDELVARRFGRRAACLRKKIDPARRIDICAQEPVDAFKIAELQAGASLIGFGGESPLTPDQYKEVLTRANIVGFTGWLDEIIDIRRDTREKAATGEQLWFQRLNDPSPTRRLSALRLLAADLRRVMEDSFDRKVKKWGIETLGKKLISVTVPILKPLGNFAQAALGGAVDTLAPDRLGQFVEELDRASLEVAKQIAALPRIEPILPQRDADLDRLMAVSASLPPSAQSTPTPAPAQRGASPESATPPSPEGAKAQAEAHARRAVELADAEKWPEAEGEYRRALALSPDMDDLCSSLAEALGAQGKWADAVDALRQAVKLAPKEANYRGELANALRKQGRLDEARREEAEAARLETEQ